VATQRRLDLPTGVSEPAEGPPPSVPYLSVTELNLHLKARLESDERLADVWVKGEVSNFKRAESGHLYFTLKDAGGQIPCAMWRRAAAGLRFDPQEGTQVLARGSVNLYEAQGKVQLYVTEMQPVGMGALYLAFVQRKQKLEREGLFDPSRKRPIPRHPRAIGVVTSLSGAAVRDVVRIATRRYPLAALVVRGVRVQGEGAAQEIAEAIAQFNAQTGSARVDVLVVGRGGGSLEDLWAFNEEVVARAIAASRIPVVSAVGHETDFTIADFVADLRAPTPSAAAELAVPDREDLLRTLDREAALLARRAADALRERAQRLDDTHERLLRGAQAVLERANMALVREAKALDSLSPLATLARGYAIARTEQGVVRSVRSVTAGEAMDVIVADGTIQTKVKRTEANP